MNEKSKNIAGLARTFYSKKTLSDSEFKSLKDQIIYLCYKFSNKKNLIKEVAGNTITKIFASFEKTFWEENMADSVENDKKILSYIITIVKESFRDEDDDLDKENINLYNTIKKKCNELVKEGFLEIVEDKYYTKSNNDSIEIFTKGSIIFKVKGLKIRRGKKGEQLDTKSVNKYLKDLFNYLEKYSLSLSDLTTIVSYNNNYGNRIFTEDIDDPDRKTDIPESGTDHFGVVNIKLINSWIRSLKDTWKEEKCLENALLIVFYAYGLTLEEISAYFKKNNISEISKSTVENRFKSSLKKIGFAEIENDPDNNKYIEEFIKKLISEFIPDKYQKEIEKLKQEKLKI